LSVLKSARPGEFDAMTDEELERALIERVQKLGLFERAQQLGFLDFGYDWFLGLRGR
jgi:hypothetical protein